MHRSALFRAALLACPALLLSFPAATEERARLRIEYGIGFMGLPVGSVRVKADIDGDRYAVEFAGRVKGVARLASSGSASAQASGAVRDGGFQPAGYRQFWEEEDDAEKISVSFVNAAARDISVEPPVRKPERYVAVADADRRDVIDPASAFLWPDAGDLSQACGRTLPIFDGRRRFDLAFTFARTDTFEARDGSYSGPAAVCAIRYRPISGHRARKESVRYMAENRDMEVWMIPVAGVLAPARIRVRSQYGHIVIEARSIAGGNESGSGRS